MSEEAEKAFERGFLAGWEARRRSELEQNREQERRMNEWAQQTMQARQAHVKAAVPAKSNWDNSFNGG